ncbi:unnamed protein product [Hermetia illucens]|uniref:Lysophospholipid acyltransferase 7 n=1 Tax=Hermetia illucens TaxID=343691 RepID=A0A7R8UUW3_HERIL|nr:lysophospholipid acyltransferase 7 [Hermetia illucens]CAD7086318.1 unnamed protein product [Hermetia illucens]
MSLDDIVYLVCLLTCIAFGKYYREIKDDSQRKVIGTALGLLIIFIVSGIHIFHTLVSFAVSAVIITQMHPSKSHLVSFAFMFGYLAFFRTTIYFGIPYPPGHTNMIQMLLTLKLVGLAFEKNTAYNKIKERERALADPGKKDEAAAIEITDYDTELQSIDITEIFHYSFNYIGILTGPYYRYRTYRDYFETPFRIYAKSTEETLRKLQQIGLYIALYLVASYLWPLNYAMSTEFYEERSFFYRLMYVWPTFFIFRMRIYSGLILGETVCTNAGFGAYPTDADIASGEGPKKSYLHLKRNPEKLTYDFTTIKNADVYGVETCWTFREAMRYWNICVQYWLAINIYKRFPSKKYRTLVLLLISSFWHGIYSGYYMCIMGAAVYTPIEDIFNKAVRKDATGLQRRIIDVLFWISKFFSFAYLGIAFLLMTLDKIWFYYNSVYHFGYLYWVVLLVVGMTITNLRRGKNRERRKHEGGESSTLSKGSAIKTE